MSRAAVVFVAPQYPVILGHANRLRDARKRAHIIDLQRLGVPDQVNFADGTLGPLNLVHTRFNIRKTREPLHELPVFFRMRVCVFAEDQDHQLYIVIVWPESRSLSIFRHSHTLIRSIR